MKDPYGRAREMEWSNTSLSGGGIVALICPLCIARVPYGNNFDGVSFRELHLRWHERIHPVQTKDQS